MSEGRHRAYTARYAISEQLQMTSLRCAILYSKQPCYVFCPYKEREGIDGYYIQFFQRKSAVSKHL
jgi:hypothetical protein